MATEFTSGAMEKSMMANGNKESDKGRESGKAVKGTFTSESGKKIKLMAMEPTLGQTVRFNTYTYL